MSSALFEVVEKLSPRTVAVVGLAKNCGKTTAFNRLVAEYASAGAALGVTSVGRDGEAADALTKRPKPSIELPPGALAVTAEDALRAWTAPRELLERLGIVTAMGEALLVRVVGRGRAELAGPPAVDGVMESIESLRRLGAERILIDGAFDRLAVGHPGLADAVVLAAGAVLGAAPASVARAAGHAARKLCLPQPEAGDLARLRRAARELENRAAVVGGDFSVKELAATALADPEEAAKASRGARWLLCGGAVTDELVEALLAARVKTGLAARDATRVFLAPEPMRRWLASGGGLCVLARVRLAALVTNPHNPTGPELDPGALADAVAAEVPGMPVFDLIAGLSRNVHGRG